MLMRLLSSEWCSQLGAVETGYVTFQCQRFSHSRDKDGIHNLVRRNNDLDPYPQCGPILWWVWHWLLPPVVVDNGE